MNSEMPQQTKKKLTITTSWDDGHPFDLRIAETLSKYGVKGTFYVPLKNDRPTLSSAQIRDLSRDFEIGAHTVNHVVLTQCSQRVARFEIVESKARIEDITGKPCFSFCFPSGRFTRDHLPMLREAGFLSFRTVELLSIEKPTRCGGIKMIPTTVQAYPHPASTYLRNAVKRINRVALWNSVRFASSSDWIATTENFMEHLCEVGGVFHLWGHSWEIDEANQWEALERAMQLLTQVQGTISHATNSELCVQ